MLTRLSCASSRCLTGAAACFPLQYGEYLERMWHQGKRTARATPPWAIRVSISSIGHRYFVFFKNVSPPHALRIDTSICPFCRRCSEAWVLRLRATLHHLDLSSPSFSQGTIHGAAPGGADKKWQWSCHSAGRQNLGHQETIQNHSGFSAINE